MNRARTAYPRVLVALPAAALLGLAACRRETPIEPPKIVFGEDTCVQCNMIINDERFAAGAVVRAADGTRTRVAFDDIGCLLEFARVRPADALLAVYVKDYPTKQWCDARAARYLHSPQLATPMASGLAAGRTPQALEELRRTCAGELLGYDQLAQLSRPSAASPPLGNHPEGERP